MSYKVKEVYYTIQGEGYHTGRPAVFCRFAGCNLWTGLEKDRENAICDFCDTEFVGTEGNGGGVFDSAKALADHILNQWPADAFSKPYVVCTGGEPLLQMDQALVDAFHKNKIEVAIETNGTVLPPKNIDWICVSPKIGADLVLQIGHELKFVYPQKHANPEQFKDMNFDHFSLQPMDGPKLKENTAKTLDYCRLHPHWNLSLQTHKFLGIP
ncbi:MAG: 7-carboxy-7-deazaguanine synthase [Candidatus Marinimicrobia bacterium]|nr:7-carboxy-7-deazaguanine synthase [Candidatus Neomarinimicrobiota bacterium]